MKNPLPAKFHLVKTDIHLRTLYLRILKKEYKQRKKAKLPHSNSKSFNLMFTMRVFQELTEKHSIEWINSPKRIK